MAAAVNQSAREQSPLAALADAVGIASGYDDVWSKRHYTPDSALRGVLGCMGFDVADEAAIAESLARVRRERLAEVLPPVIVRRCAQPDAAEDADSFSA